MRPRGIGRQLWRQWLGIGAGGHAQRRQHQFVQDRVEWLAGAVDHRLLHHGVAAARVAEGRPRRRSDPDGLRVGGAGAIEHLLQRRHALAGGVAGKARDAHATGVRQQLAQARHAVTLRQRPAGERLVDACVQIELALFDHAQRCHGRHGFAERGGLEQRLRRDGRSAGPGHAIAARPGHLAVLDHGHAHARYVQPFHFVDEGQGRYRHIGQGDFRAQAGLDAGDGGAVVGAVIGVCAGSGQHCDAGGEIHNMGVAAGQGRTHLLLQTWLHKWQTVWAPAVRPARTERKLCRRHAEGECDAPVR